MILGKAVIEPDAPTNSDASSLEKYNRISTRLLSPLEIVSSRSGRVRPAYFASRSMTPRGCITTSAWSSMAL